MRIWKASVIPMIVIGRERNPICDDKLRYLNLSFDSRGKYRNIKAPIMKDYIHMYK